MRIGQYRLGGVQIPVCTECGGDDLYGINALPLEDAIKLVKDYATEYVLKKTLKYTDKTNEYGTDESPKKKHKNPKISFEMRSHPANKHIVNIYKEIARLKEGWISDEIKTSEQKVAYFCYTTYKSYLDLEPQQQQKKNKTTRKTARRDRFGNIIDPQKLKNSNNVVNELKESRKYKENNNN